MDVRAVELGSRVRARGLPPAVEAIAVRGGAEVHPALAYRAQAVSAAADGPAWTVVAMSGRDDLVPLWTCGTATVFSAGDGSFLHWDAEEDQPWRAWPTFAGPARHLLTDLWEDETDDAERVAVARLLLPAEQIAAALVPEDR
ncbi:hypothetical protein ACFPM7_20620 [Actinokineospora guangxiensis]|uniref:Uncharacterized protein n=1 Tax=Actinokineospora guangxiensis TaxID=1490288 RepID=A0ABW0EPW5_9PSEU